MEIRQLREKIMCTIIDKQFESAAWRMQIQNLNLQTSSVPPVTPSPSLSVSSPETALINNYERQCKHTRTLNLLSLSRHSFNLFPLYPHHPPLINNFPAWSSAFPYTNSKSLHDLGHPHPPPLLYLRPYTSSISVSDTRAGSEESRQDRSWQQAWQAARSIKCLRGGREAWCVGGRRESSRGTGAGAKVRPMVPLH